MTTGEKIYQLRKKALITQEEFAEKLEVTRQAVSKWESDTAYPETDKIIKIAELFGVSCDYLLKENQTINDGACGKQRRAFLSMMISFSVACIALGFVIAIICYFAVRDWYSCLIGLGVLAGLILAAFVLWSVGRYRFLSECDYSEADKKHLAIWTKAFFFTTVIVLFLYLPTVVFIELEGTYTTPNGYWDVAVTYLRKLTGREFALCLLVYGATGYCVANVLNFAHNAVLGKELNPVKLTDAVCVAVSALGATAALSYSIYESDSFGLAPFVAILIFSTVFAVAVIVQAIIHKIYEKINAALFVFQIVCALAFVLIPILINSFEDYSGTPYIVSLISGGILALGCIVCIAVAITSAVNRKSFKELLLIRLSLLSYIIFGIILIVSIFEPIFLIDVIISFTVFIAAAAILHAPFVKEKSKSQE
ncbi:MAG: helix-turn-helix domain-containing protein [Clostridia bacterium]|nr:helix-turn-helix domain-containing protein [Clostridia bacterium]